MAGGDGLCPPCVGSCVGLALPISSMFVQLRVRLSQTGAQLCCWLKMNSRKWQPGLPTKAQPHILGTTQAPLAGQEGPGLEQLKKLENKYKEKVSNDSVQNSWQ